MQSTQSSVVFRGDDGMEIRGNLTRLSPHQVVFEVHSPLLALRLSEALKGVEVIVQGRIVYAGGAVVSGLVNTGTGMVCEARLSDSWVDLEFLNGGADVGRLREGLGKFLGEWQKVYTLMPEYKLIIADMQSFLHDLRAWLERVELSIRSTPAADRNNLEMEAISQIEPTTTSAIRALFDRFEAVTRQVEPERTPAHIAFGRRLIHPLLLSSPFVHRTFAKPLGYAGDYEMVSMMVRDPRAGPSLYAKAINIYALELPPIVAHRNRLKILQQRLEEESLRVARLGKPLRVLNVGCGPAHEIQRFLTESSLSDRVHFTLIDFNAETLDVATRVLNEFRNANDRKAHLKFVHRSVHQILKDAFKSGRAVGDLVGERFDFVYCAGLFDYLSDQVCQNLMDYFYGLTAPGGLVLSTNVDDHPSRLEMEYFLEWHLIYRGHQQMWDLMPQAASPQDGKVIRDDTGVNLFLDVRKPERV